MRLLKTLDVVAVVIILMAAAGGVTLFVIEQDGQIEDSPINQTETPTPDVPNAVEASIDQTEDFRVLFNEQYDYSEASIYPRNDGAVVMLDYDSTAGNSVKDEMQDIAVLYAQSAEGKDEMPALVIHTNGVTMTVPGDTAVAHGNGDINEEAYLKNVRYE